MSFVLRPYQQLALDTLWDYIRHADGNPALVLPTGAGKSPLMAAIAHHAVTVWGGRVGILAHVQELVGQTHGALLRYWPGAPAGIYAAGLKRRDRFDQALVMQIQSVAERAAVLGHFDLLLVDEAHRIPLKGEGRYLRFIEDARRINPALRVVGLTATPYRLQGAAVPVCGPGHVLTEVAYEARIPDLISQGYLSPLVSKAGERPDLAGVHTKGGEYVESELAAAMQADGLVDRTCDDLVVRAADRRSWIVFCVNVAHAEHVQTALQARGIAAGLVHGGTPKAERARELAQFQTGALRAMVNVNVLSEGFDAPGIDCVAMLRPTKSPGLYYQQVGRGFRMAPGKADCLVLDYAGNMLEHGPVDAIRVRGARPGKAATVETVRAKECPGCATLLAFGVRECPECGHSFASTDPAHSDRPIDAPVLSTQRAPVISTHAVTGVKYARGQKAGRPPYLRATYQCGLRRFNDFVCLEHAGGARAAALRWWQARSTGAVPRSVDEALACAYGLPTPAEIVVDETEKYPRIIEARFVAAEAEDAPLVTGDARKTPDWLARAIERRAA